MQNDEKVTIGFRQAQQSDIPYLLQLRKDSMGEHLVSAGLNLSDQQHLERISEFLTDSSIILMDKQPIGLIKLGVLADKLHIRQLQISPKYQGKGVGSKVLALVKKKAKELKLPLTLNVLLANPVISLYLRHGFIVIGQNELEYQMRCD
ncbi:GNAT family N-acetyltransferase [Colwellia sp. Bg11-12]|uniref:GNAT family N-acetyltransferase n=1 Tax=Colwellia sp. Bg11-12 TaxID=2759817 RepID=UPI0021751BBE|nr:GNAT family N-acetyltransferase [Colwellia sp. Bg11-12]